ARRGATRTALAAGSSGEGCGPPTQRRRPAGLARPGSSSVVYLLDRGVAAHSLYFWSDKKSREVVSSQGGGRWGRRLFVQVRTAYVVPGGCAESCAPVSRSVDERPAGHIGSRVHNVVPSLCTGGVDTRNRAAGQACRPGVGRPAHRP